MTVDERVHAFARSLGFDAVGVARADEALEDDHRRYLAFVGAGMHGGMAYLAEHAEVRRRLDTGDVLAGARSVVCVARRYDRPAEDEARDPALARLVARYARGRDYHNFLRKKLRRLARFLRGLGTVDEPVHARPMVDDVPVLERAWAARAGLGFVGKHGLLIVPGQGSMVLLGEVVTTLALTPGTPMVERCGSCTRCLDVCPTEAFAAPWVLDPRRCVAYLTIEHRGPVPEDLASRGGDHLFGCDDCQTACPFNAGALRGGLRRGAPGGEEPRAPAASFLPDERWSSFDLVGLLALDEAGFLSATEGSPLRRATWAGLVRNAAYVLGRRRDRDALPALQRTAQDHPVEDVREAARQAVRWIQHAPGNAPQTPSES